MKPGKHLLFLLLLLLLAASTALTGCATKMVNQGDGFALGNFGEPREFVFKTTSPDGSRIPPDAIVAAFAEPIQRASGIKPVERTWTRHTSMDLLRGLDVQAGDSAVVVSYVNGTAHDRNSPEKEDRIYATRSSARFSIDVIDEGDVYRVRLHPPTRVRVIEETMVAIPSKDPLLKRDSLEADLERILNEFEPTLKLYYLVSGEREVQRSPEELLRLVPLSNGIGSREPARFPFPSDRNRYVYGLGIDYFPYEGQLALQVFNVSPSEDTDVYKEGQLRSFVRYAYPVPFTLNGDGSSNFSQEIARRLRERVHEVLSR